MEIDPDELKQWLEEMTHMWPTCLRIERWLDAEFHPPWPQDVRREWDVERRVIWTVPDYDNGRSRSLAVDRDVLLNFDSDAITSALITTDFQRIIDEHDLLIREGPNGNLEVVTWRAPQFEKWFWSPEHGEWFAVAQSSSSGVSTGAPPPPIHHFVGIHGKSYGAVGPDGIVDVGTLTYEDIKRFLPQR